MLFPQVATPSGDAAAAPLAPLPGALRALRALRLAGDDGVVDISCMASAEQLRCLSIERCPNVDTNAASQVIWHLPSLHHGHVHVCAV